MSNKRDIIFSSLILFAYIPFCQPVLTRDKTFKKANQPFTINGRQLFVLNSCIDTTTLQKVFHFPNYYSGNPVLKADRPWEFNSKGDPYAAPFSGGVWFDERGGKFKMWYSAGGGKNLGMVTCYAESDDGIQWSKPILDIIKGTNIVDTSEHDCVSVLFDKFECDSTKRYKMFVVAFNNTFSVNMRLKYSTDGIHWGNPIAVSGELFDRCAAYYDPFREKYVLSLKTLNGKYRRSRNFLSSKDPELLVSLAHRTFDLNSDKFIRYWFNAEDDDPRNPRFPEIRPQIYNHEAIPYEGLLLGYFTIWQGPENKECDSLGIQKRNEVLIGWSQDGFHWIRDNKTPFFPVSTVPDSWNEGNIQSTNGNPLLVGDSLYFYMSGRYNNNKWDSNISTGLATLRRDGFVSMSTKHEGYLVMKELVFTGKYLFVNSAIKGSLQVEILDVDGKAIPGYTKEECRVIRINSTKQLVTWNNRKNVSGLRNKPVRIKFFVNNGDLYSFWVSKWETGESNGFTAGGGPGLNPIGVDAPVKNANYLK